MFTVVVPAVSVLAHSACTLCGADPALLPEAAGR